MSDSFAKRRFPGRERLVDVTQRSAATIYPQLMDAPDESFRTIFAALRAAAAHDPALRAALRAALLAISAELDQLDAEQPDSPPRDSPPSDSRQPPAVAEEAAAPPAHLPDPPPPPRTWSTLRVGDSELPILVRASAPEAPRVPGRAQTFAPAVVYDAPVAAATFSALVPGPLEGDLIARRCRLKARALLWQRERIARLNADECEAVSAADRELIDAARREPDCFLWMCRPDYHAARTDADLDEAAGSYDALAEAAELTAGADEACAANPSDPLVRDAMLLLGEAQSSLRVTVERADVKREDPDQGLAFFWLRRETAARGVYVPHLQYAMPADPAGHVDLRRRIAELAALVDARRNAACRRRNLFKKVEWHAARLARGGGNGSGADGDADWRRIAEVVEALVADGVPPSNRELRDLLLPVHDDVPALEFGPGLCAVLGEVDRYAAQDEPDDGAAAPQRAPSLTVCAARKLLAGRVVVLIGGLPRELQRRKIERALGLAELRWVSVFHHQSMEAELLWQFRRPEVSLFITMTRFRSHQLGPQLRAWCKEYGKSYVELPGGYGVEQVAHQVLAQVSHELEAGSA